MTPQNQEEAKFPDFPISQHHFLSAYAVPCDVDGYGQQNPGFPLGAQLNDPKALLTLMLGEKHSTMYRGQSQTESGRVRVPRPPARRGGEGGGAKPQTEISEHSLRLPKCSLSQGH